jgi:hypothetical protein
MPGSMTPDDVVGQKPIPGRGEMLDEEEDDLVAISGEDSFLRGESLNSDGGPGYRQIDGIGISSGRGMDRATIMRKILINLALIGSWCESLAI